MASTRTGSVFTPSKATGDAIPGITPAPAYNGADNDEREENENEE